MKGYFVLMFLLIGVFSVVSARAHKRTSALLDIVEADLAENQRKDAVRDQWMRAHQGDLMTQIEARMK